MPATNFLACLVAICAFAGQAKTLPNLDQLFFATAPPTPISMKETAQASRLTSVAYTNPYLTRPLKNRHALDSKAVLCLVSWSFRTAHFNFPGKITAMWGVYESQSAAKLAALARTWGPKARPPKPSIPAGSFTGAGLGSECWHSTDPSTSTIVTYKDRIVVQIVELPPSRLQGKKTVFDKFQPKNSLMLETLATQILARTAAFLKSHP